LNLIDIIYNFIMQNEKEKQALDLAVIIEALLIESVEFKNCEDTATRFLRQLVSMGNAMKISTTAFT